ncbi:hypothetical protein AB1Y20_003151 [Prymnesium parvum]|uniref:Tetratricopeptide repeat protein n=1 Tax=Prymnesium parvum TaxID=97485 RepID=A0AB34JE01_PRYPA
MKATETAGELAASAQACMEAYELEQGLKLYRRAVKLEPDNVEILDAYGEACLQAGKRDDARKALMHSVEIQPEGAASRYMYLGQLLEGADAIRSFERGVSILRAERAEAGQRSGSRGELQRLWVESTHALATGLCSAAEIYLTDACDEPDAEERCEALATEAVALVEGLREQTLAEPYVTLASLRLSQQRNDEAEPLLQKACDVVNNCEETALPPFDCRLSLSKMLMEVGKPEDALELLQMLRLEDDDSLELRYLLVFAASQAGDTELAAEEVVKAIAYAESDACPVEEREWLDQLKQIQSEIGEADMEG